MGYFDVQKGRWRFWKVGEIMDFFYSLKSALLIAAKIALVGAMAGGVLLAINLIGSVITILTGGTSWLSGVMSFISLVPALISHYGGAGAMLVYTVLLGVAGAILVAWVFVKVVPALQAAISLLSSDK